MFQVLRPAVYPYSRVHTFLVRRDTFHMEFLVLFENKFLIIIFLVREIAVGTSKIMFVMRVVIVRTGSSYQHALRITDDW